MYSMRALHCWFMLAAGSLVLSRALMAHPGTDVAIIDLTALISSSPDSAELRLRRATCYVEHQSWPEAAADIDYAARLSPDHPDLALARAEYFLARNEPIAAIQALASHLISHPADPAGHILRARARTLSGDNLGAQNDFELALRYLTEPKPELWLEANALITDPIAALAHLEIGLSRLGPVPALEERALKLELQLGRSESAIQRLARLAAHSERPETYHRRRGDILVQANKLPEARRAYADALAAIERLPDWLRRSESTQQLIAQITALVTTTL
ncbi:MAG: tetratricopeptide repeat protein [Opitutaceae bacterium]